LNTFFYGGAGSALDQTFVGKQDSNATENSNECEGSK
jgi:hypothetical protein